MSEFSVVEEWQKQMPVEIPMLWQVVYYEGIHGNHILFSPSDLEHFAKTCDFSSSSLEASEINDLGFSLLGAVSYREMVEKIENCSLIVREQIFRLYQRWLCEVGRYIKGEAH